MATVTIQEAQAPLAELIDHLRAGEELTITRGDQPIAAADTDVLISPATLWEMAIKVRLGEYTLPGPFGPLASAA